MKLRGEPQQTRTEALRKTAGAELGEECWEGGVVANGDQKELRGAVQEKAYAWQRVGV